MLRREFIALLGTSVLPWTLTAKAQPSRKIARIGVLFYTGNAEQSGEYFTVLAKAFRDLGYIEGKNIEFLYRFAAGQLDRFPILARELIESQVDVAIATTQEAAAALKQVTSTIPVVFVLVPDPVGQGFVASLVRPGGNLTGLSLMAFDLYGKVLELLKELVPNLSSVALFFDAGGALPRRAAFPIATEALGLSSRVVAIPAPDAIEPAFAQAQRDHVDGIVIAGSMLFRERARVGAAALAHRMPAICYAAEMVPYGLLMSYGPDLPDYYRKAAGYADRILRGAKPSDLPVEQPTRLKQVINLKVAKALGLAIPQSLLVTTDEVIE